MPSISSSPGARTSCCATTKTRLGTSGALCVHTHDFSFLPLLSCVGQHPQQTMPTACGHDVGSAGDWRQADNTIDSVQFRTLRFEAQPATLSGGDDIRVTALRSNLDACRVGGTFELEGQYTLASEPKAVLAASITGGVTCGHEGLRGHHVTISRGSGTFHLRFEIVQMGKLHVSFFRRKLATRHLQWCTSIANDVHGRAAPK